MTTEKDKHGNIPAGLVVFKKIPGAKNGEREILYGINASLAIEKDSLEKHIHVCQTIIQLLTETQISSEGALPTITQLNEDIEKYKSKIKHVRLQELAVERKRLRAELGLPFETDTECQPPAKK